jgi:outer membrane receptor protein involved in Fe transport
MKRVVAMVGLMTLLCGSPCVAQETTGDIMGTITSEDGVPLGGVTVTAEATDTGLFRSTESNVEGFYRFAALPPARYTVTASLDGFKTLRRELEVDLGRTAAGNITMSLGEFTDIIEVTGELPLVDVTSTVSGMAVNSDELMARVPVQREVTELAILAPGAFAAPQLWQKPAWTGMYTPGQALASISGSSVGENAVQVNGLNITNFRNMMGASFVPMEFVDEVQVKTGGYEAEYGRSTGGVINMVTKTGGNAFRGGLSAYWEPKALQDKEPNTFDEFNQEEEREALEVNASLGGPIVRDRLLFFGFVRYSDTFFDDVYTDIADRHETSTPYWGGKLDWSITPEHRVEVTYVSDDVEVDFVRADVDPESRTVVDVRGTGVRSRGGENIIAKYTGILSDSVVVSAQAGRNEFDRTNASDGDECPRVIDSRGEVDLYPGCNVRGMRGSDWDTRNAYRLDVDWFVGNHSLRAGADYEINESWSDEQYSGGVYYRYFLNGAEDQDPEDYRYPELPWNQELVRVRRSFLGGVYDVNSSAAYLQDSWRPTPNLTVNLGVRWERYENSNSLGETFIETNDQWAPRLGAIWDPTGEGGSKLYGSFGVFHLPVASITNIKLASALYLDDAWHTFNGILEEDGSPSELGDELQYSLWLDGETPDPRETISENFDPMAQGEVILGYERMIGANWSAGVRAVARWFEEVIEDYTIEEGLWVAFGIPCLDPELLGTSDYCYNHWRLGNPGGDFEGWFDVDGDGVLDRIIISAEDLGYPPAERTYYGLELSFSRRFANNWMLQGSYTWSHSYGNYEGPIRSEMFQAWAGMNSNFDLPGMMEHSTGDLFNDRRHNVKLFGVYAWPFGFQVGGSFFYHTGRPINSFGRHPTDPWVRDAGWESFFTGGEPAPRGCCGRTDDIWSLDLMLKYDFLAAGIQWNVRADIFNVFDNQGVDWYWEFAEDSWNGAPDPYYGEPLMYQTPRSVRFGFGVSF